jgi:predicted unusual protein kinase regulating ubiquinone biosynthesis (AarF/ABC1/UbiB family)
VSVVPDNTQELDVEDLVRGPPLPPAAGPGAAPASTAPPPEGGRASVYRKPWRRLVKAYFVTTQVVVSYVFLAVRQRFRSGEGAAALLDEAHRRNARRVEKAIVQLQGLFIKVGQLISIMANFLPEAFRRELQGLQDQVPARPYRDIEARLREEFDGRSPDEVFAEFARQPVASASIGQVHVARLKSGEPVAVKVQYPDIDVIVRTDLRALKRIFAVLRWFMPDWGFDTIYGEIREMVLAELDYRQEADAIRAISANFQGRRDVLFPRVMADYSTARVLTTEWMTGIKVADLDRLAAQGIDRRKAARLCVEAYCQQIFVDGVYHADPHPGNILLRPGGADSTGPSMVFLDFGATAQVSQKMRKGLVSFLQGAMTRDTARIVSAMKEMGFISRRANPEVFDRVVEHFHEQFRAQVRFDGFSLKDIRLDAGDKLSTLLDLRELNVSLADLRDAFHVPKEWVLLERTLLLLLGVCTTLDPEMNPVGVIQPYVDRFLLGEKKEWSEAVLEASREATLSALALPGEIGRFVKLATRGDLEMRVRNLEEGVRVVYTVGQQLLWAFLGATAAGFAVVFDGRGQVAARSWAESAAAVFGGLFFIAVLRGRRLLRKRR